MEISELIRIDPEAGVRRLVEERGKALRAFALRLCGDPADADDLYVRTLERAVARAAEQRGPSLAAWLRAICLNLHRMDLRRRAPPVAPGADPGEVPDAARSPLEETIARAEAAEVRAAVERLPERHRRLVLLRYWDGLSQPEVAARTGDTEGTVKRILSEARGILRADLESRFDHD